MNGILACFNAQAIQWGWQVWAPGEVSWAGGPGAASSEGWAGTPSILVEFFQSSWRGGEGVVNVGTALTSDCTTGIRQTWNSSSSQSWNFTSTILPFIPAFNAAASEFQVRKWEKKWGLYWVAVEKTLRCLRFRYKTWILCSSLSLSECFPLCLCLVNAWGIDFLPVWTGFPASLFVLVFSTLW